MRKAMELFTQDALGGPWDRVYRAWCALEGITVTESAEVVGTSPTYLSRVINGVRPCGAGLARKILNVTGIDPLAGTD